VKHLARHLRAPKQGYRFYADTSDVSDVKLQALGAI
jgi:hypothetical protein